MAIILLDGVWEFICACQPWNLSEILRSKSTSVTVTVGLDNGGFIGGSEGGFISFFGFFLLLCGGTPRICI